MEGNRREGTHGYLQELGVEIGMRVRLVKAEKYEGPLTLETNQKDIRSAIKQRG